MKLLYFSWVREQVGCDEEDVTPPDGTDTVGVLLDWLATRGPGYAAALANRSAIRVAVNQDYADDRHPVGPRDEIALFPPVTGG